MSTRDLSPHPQRVFTRSNLALVAAALAALVLLLVASLARAATPGSGTIDLTHPQVTWTGSITGAGSGENTCVNGVSCDSFKVVLAPGDYTGKQINVAITWLVPAYDYDLYVHRDSLRGPGLPSSAGPPPATQELVHVGIDPPIVLTPRVWWAHPQAASVPPGQTYNGSATLVNAPPSPVVTHLPGTLTFSHTVPLYARGTVRTEEPSVRVDVRGNCYVGGIRGVPAGVDMWRFDLNRASPNYDPELKHATYLGQPDAFQQMGAEDSTAGGADGGGDIEIATSFPTDPDSTPVMTMVSLAVANISSSLSYDRGTTWVHNAAAATISSDDRQWIECDGPNTVYLFYRALVPAEVLFVQKSTDHGMTYGPAVPVIDNNNPASTSPGYIDVDHTDGTIYVSHSSDNALYVSHSSDGGQTWATVLVDGLTAHGHLFDPVKVGDDGTVYVAWSNDRHIYYSFSSDHGNTWTAGAPVEDPALTLVNVFPWLEAGSAGRVDVVWFGTQDNNNSAAEWKVYFAQSLNANSPTPVFRQQIISDHVIHGQNISEGGLTGSADRNLGDYFQIAYDTQGAAVVAFGDDHNDFDGNTYVTRQLDGPSLLASANNNTGYVQSVPLSPLPSPELTGPEVTDPVHDAVIQTQPVPTDNPFDITSITYFANNDGPGGPFVGARMKLSGLTAAPPNGLWRIAFTANAPNQTDQLPTGTSDHGDMFYMLCTDTSASGPVFSYGTAYRDSNPLAPVVFTAYAMAYNAAAGVADSGAIDTTTGTVTIKVAVSKLNALLPAGHAPIAQGSWLTGLRGNAGAVGRGPRDDTRGGLRNFLVNFSGPLAVGGPPAPRFAVSAAPNPARGGNEIHYALPAADRVTLGIFDVQGRLVRALTPGRIEAAGPHVLRWDGRTSAGAPAPDGMYFARLRSGGREIAARFVMMR
jgi:flagellar hook capping protein FlgD